MEATLNEDFETATQARRPHRGRATRLSYDLPDLYDTPRRRMSPMLVAGMAFATFAGAFYIAEATLPPPYKPSRFTGGYEKEMALARAEGEAIAKVEAEKKLKVVETAAVQLQERCRATLHRGNTYYQAALDRANTGFKLYGEQLGKNAELRNQVAANTTGADQQVATFATLLAYGGAAVGADDFASKSLSVADAARERALKIVEEAQRRGVAISPTQWDYGLPTVDQLSPVETCALPPAVIAPSLEAGL